MNRTLFFILAFLLLSLTLRSHLKQSHELLLENGVAHQAAAAPLAMISEKSDGVSKSKAVDAITNVNKSSSTRRHLSLAAIQEVRKCLGHATPTEITTQDELIQNFLKEHAPASQTLVSLNKHYRFPDGRERRVRKAESDSEIRTHDLQVFDLDQDGLPYPIRLPTTQRGTSSEEDVKKLVQGGQLIFEESSEKLTTRDHLNIELEKENRSVRVAHIRGRSLNLRCFADDLNLSFSECRCLTN